jgi:putative addiction module killer protein
MYFTMRGGALVILLAGGDKRTQDADIKRAGKLARGMTHENETQADSL